MKKILLICFAILSVVMITGCDEMDTVIRDAKPFWLEKTMKNESVMIIDDGEEVVGNLMFVPTKIVSIKDSSLKITYKEGVDYTVSGRTIKRTSNSTMPYLYKDVLYGIAMPSNQGLSTQPASSAGIAKGYNSVLYTESSFLFKHQIFVTYEYNNSDYTGYRQNFVGNSLPNTLAKLQNKDDLNIVVYGDSISTGNNASGSELMSVYEDSNSQYISWGIEPYGKSFPELFADELTHQYGSEIMLLSAGKGGMDSNWGKNSSLMRAYNPDYGYDPDLVLIHFGVNDSTMMVNEDVFKQNITQIINDIRLASTKTVEFILIGAMFSNPDAIQIGKNTNYIDELNEIANEMDGVVSVDVGSVHLSFTEVKSYFDLTANNVNHPNDFLHRIYAMILNAALVEYK